MRHVQHSCCKKQNVKKGFWSPDEDEKLIRYFTTDGGYGCSWSEISEKAGLQRCGKSCRLRWINYLRPDLRRGSFTQEEKDMIISLHGKFGNRWSYIARHLAGRTDNDVKNYWNSCINKKMKKKNTTSTNGRQNDDEPPQEQVLGFVNNQLQDNMDTNDLSVFTMFENNGTVDNYNNNMHHIHGLNDQLVPSEELPVGYTSMTTDSSYLTVPLMADHMFSVENTTMAPVLEPQNCDVNLMLDEIIKEWGIIDQQH